MLVLVGHDGVDFGHQLEKRQALRQAPGGQQRVAVQQDDGGIAGRTHAGHGTQRTGHQMALAAGRPAHKREPDLGRRLHLQERPLDPALVRELADAGDDGGRAGVTNRLGDRGLIDARGGFAADPRGSDHDVDV